MLIKAGIGLGFMFALAGAAWWIGSQLDQLAETKIQLVEAHGERDTAKKEARDARSELAAERQARLLDLHEGTADFEKADWACHQTIKKVVAARAIKPVPREYFTQESQTDETQKPNCICGNVALPDLYRLRNVQAAGSDPAN
jgi:hypothetical protein